MRSDSRRARGQSLVEMLVAMLALVPLYFGIAWLAKVVDIRLATQAAARSLAFECTVRIEACRDAAAMAVLAAELRGRHFDRHERELRSGQGVTAASGGPVGPPLWRDRAGNGLLESFDGVAVTATPRSFDAPLGFVGGNGERAIAGAVRILSELAGPARFGLQIGDGLVRATIETAVSPSRNRSDWVQRLLGAPLTLQAGLAILTDGWDASGPYGPAPDSVETRVAAGARVPGADAALEAAWLPIRGVLAVARGLGLESRAALLRWHEVDVDLVPPDRLHSAPFDPAPNWPPQDPADRP